MHSLIMFKLNVFINYQKIKNPINGDFICISGGSSGNWTSDTRIFSPLLYRLSYEAKWRFQRDLNPWSLAWQASVIGRYTMEPLVAGEGFEPTTFGLWARRATRLLPSRDISTWRGKRDSNPCAGYPTSWFSRPVPSTGLGYSPTFSSAIWL